LASRIDREGADADAGVYLVNLAADADASARLDVVRNALVRSVSEDRELWPVRQRP
jgi:hypothetical protein